MCVFLHIINFEIYTSIAEYIMKKIAFPPLVSDQSTILILGTMPGMESLRLQQYYGHPQNHFWKIMFTLFNEPFSTDYEVRIALLMNYGIALWDVLHSCEGEGSADSAIVNENANDFEAFFKEYPHIRKVFFASLKAEAFYKKHVGFRSDKVYGVLPSPSPANARMSLASKIERWRGAILEKKDNL